MKENKKSAVSEAEMINTIMDNITDSIYFKDLEGRFILINKACAKKIGIKEPDDAVGKTDFDFFTKEYAEKVHRDEQRIIKTKKPIVNIEEKETWQGKENRWASSTKMPFYNKKGEIIGTFGISRDITEQKKAEEKIWYLSFHDKLTGLYNRAFFEEELKRLDTKRQLPLSIIFCDVNGLKEINENFGYERGDLLLRKFAEVLKSCFRNEDVVVRWGGDEFIMILPNTDEMDVENVTKRIQLKCQQKSKPNMPMSAAIGSAIKTKESQDIDLVVNDAEKRMIADKKQ
jgi:diguanylate cyclase (GGDEF)-like protein/PAS domain S-box-containing protein